jgi:hypothetical protein
VSIRTSQASIRDLCRSTLPHPGAAKKIRVVVHRSLDDIGPKAKPPRICVACERLAEQTEILAERVALDGKFVIPGLINAHGHVNAPGDLRTYAAYGVTTVFSLGSEPPEVFAQRAGQSSPTLDRARVFVAGPVLSPTTLEQVRVQVADIAARKADIVKIRVDDPATSTPGPKLDVGANDFTIELWVKGALADNAAPAVVCGANGAWVNGTIVLDGGMVQWEIQRIHCMPSIIRMPADCRPVRAIDD